MHLFTCIKYDHWSNQWAEPSTDSSALANCVFNNGKLAFLYIRPSDKCWPMIIKPKVCAKTLILSLHKVKKNGKEPINTWVSSHLLSGKKHLNDYNEVFSYLLLKWFCVSNSCLELTGSRQPSVSCSFFCHGGVFMWISVCICDSMCVYLSVSLSLVLCETSRPHKDGAIPASSEPRGSSSC